MPRFVLGIEYDGSGYAGWQWQHATLTVQGVLETALSKIANQPISVLCAGRTDAGVHALEQIVHFDCPLDRDPHAWVMGGNSHLPDDVRILWAQPAIADFHARYSAIARLYRYVIINRAMKSALRRTQATWCYQTLDESLMHAAAQYLIGEHDFSSFRAQSCQSVSPNRYMHFIDVYRQAEFVYIDICANAFLHHMVRNISGALIAIGMQKRPVNWILELLELKDRSQSAATAPPHGLHLAGVYYPKHYGLKTHPLFNKLPENTQRYD